MTRAEDLAATIFRQAVAAVDPHHAVSGHCDELLRLYRQGGYERLLVLGGGKGGAAMARAVEDGLGDLISDGAVVIPHGYPVEGLKRIAIYHGGHPLPDAPGVAATGRILRLAEGADARTLAVVLVSGGGSALLVAPVQGVSLADKGKTANLLMGAGADIRSLNTVRKHLSRIKGGRLAALIHPATVVSLILSDVIDDPLDVIASGPTAPDPTSFADALLVLRRFRLAAQVPPSVMVHLSRGATKVLPETPKPGDPLFAGVTNTIVGSNRTAVAAARRAAEGLGMRVVVEPEPVCGEAREAGRVLARRARALRAERAGDTPLCLLAGGETVVTVAGTGTGGRNQELALAFALEIEGEAGITLLSAGTDGIDGPTDAAGALVDGTTAARGRTRGLDPDRYLADNDSHTFLRATDSLFVTGPTGTNVMDLQIVILD
ncbi:MAG TPA: DUF4147 domain-containing protein [Geobacteraceae bacterium]